MKSRYFLITALITVLTLMALVMNGCGLPTPGNNKTTGGGWFYNTGVPGANNYNQDSTQKVTFGFNAQPIGDPLLGKIKGNFELVDHDNKVNIHGTFTSTNWSEGTTNGLTDFSGAANINGQIFNFECTFYDGQFNGEFGTQDGVFVYAYDGTTNYQYAGALQGGNIKVH